MELSMYLGVECSEADAADRSTFFDQRQCFVFPVI